MVIEMDRDEKIARLEAWLDEHKEEFLKAQDKLWLRTYDAVYHELDRQIDKKIIEELGILTEGE